MLNVVLHEPEIPNNTGNIGRTCVATGACLHLIEPLGFDIDEKACRRAGLDYWPRLDLHTHLDFESYADSTKDARRWLLSTKGSRSVYEADFEPSDHLVFGKESKGLPDDLLESHCDRVICLPMMPGERSLNLSSAVCVVVYEAIRQMIVNQHSELNANKRLIHKKRI
ncbi:MAG: tRNA (cytidine(34)-2'-O)-methyltransferase [Phycisphaera sp.]|nr:MAG: tRNA (cytidine(34)-2'-O)-methyltransferase [Phycisphaera sp.]